MVFERRVLELFQSNKTILVIARCQASVGRSGQVGGCSEWTCVFVCVFVSTESTESTRRGHAMERATERIDRVVGIRDTIGGSRQVDQGGAGDEAR